MERPMQYAYEVYKQKSFSKAAEKLYISQPALSAIIKKLEDSLGVPLFDRSTKPVSLTPAGEYYIHCAEEITAVETGMQQYFDDMLALKKGSVRIGASTYFCSNVLPDVLRGFRDLYPYLSVHLVESNSTPELREKLLSKEIDFALTSNTYPTEDYECLELGFETIILAVPADHPINEELSALRYSYAEIVDLLSLSNREDAVIRRTPLHHFHNESFITIDRISDLYPRILTMFREEGVTPNIVMHLQQMSSCYFMAANGFGCAFLRSSTLQTVKDTGRLYFYCIDSPHASRMTRLYFKRGGYMSRAMNAFMEFVRP